jgi:hypothetical protein
MSTQLDALASSPTPSGLLLLTTAAERKRLHANLSQFQLQFEAQKASYIEQTTSFCKPKVFVTRDESVRLVSNCQRLIDQLMYTTAGSQSKRPKSTTKTILRAKTASKAATAKFRPQSLDVQLNTLRRQLKEQARL